MSATPPSGPKGPEHPPEPIKPQSTPKTSSGSHPSESATSPDSPFAKMFERSGVTPTAKQLKMMMSSLLRQTLTEIKRDDERWKKAMKKLKKEIEGQN